MLDKFRNIRDSLVTPGRRSFTVTPHATDPIEPLPKGLIMGSAGNITYRAVDSTADVTLAVVHGQFLPVRTQYVRAAGTTVTQIVAVA